MKLDTYTFQARIIPAVVALLPVFVLSYRLVQLPDVAALSDYVLGIKIAGTATVGLILLFVFANIVRQAGLWVQRRYFADGFPTTYLVLRDEPFSDAFKAQYAERVQQDFKIVLDEPGLGEAEQKRRFNDAAQLVLKHAGDTNLVLKHNTWYGLNRNLVGGAYWGLALSILNVVLSLVWLHDQLVVVCSILLGLVYLVLIVAGKGLVTQHGEAFATQLLTTYVAGDSRIS